VEEAVTVEEVVERSQTLPEPMALRLAQPA
jgi:hypothetical protein